MAIISDGGEDVAYPTSLPWRPVQRILDWFHISMRFEHVLQRLRGLRKTGWTTADTLLARVESAKWRLWHGRAADCLEQLKTVLPQARDGLKARVAELIAYLGRNRERLVDYGTQHRSGLPISTSMAESAVESVIGGRFKKNRKMRWTPKGANALLHIRQLRAADDRHVGRRGRTQAGPELDLLGVPDIGEQFFGAPHDGVAAHAVRLAVVAVELGRTNS